MVDLSLLSPSTQSSSPVEIVQASIRQDNGSTSVLSKSRRPAILTHASPIVETANVLANLPLFVLGVRKESEWIEISMFEGIEFAKGWKNVPDRVRLVVEADEKMQFYDAEVKIQANFRGLRYNPLCYRLLSKRLTNCT
jgi:hypothetical protein